MAEQIIVEILVDDSQLQPAIDRLEKTGQIDAKLAGAFRQTTAEINKQATAIKANAAATAPLKKNLEEVGKVAKSVTEKLVLGAADYSKMLKESGATAGEFFDTLVTGANKAQASANKVQTSPFDKLNKSLSDTTKRVLDASARLEQLRRTGGEGTEAFKNFEKQLKADQHELKKLGDELAAVNQATDVFGESEKGAGNAMENVRSRLRDLNNQLRQLKLSGEDNTAQFREIAAEAGRLQKSIDDANKEVRNFAASTPLLNGILSATQGIAGGFAVVQGAAALFGDESEELQETLLRVNAAMAILQGLQQVEAVLGKESAAIKLADVIATKAQIAVQKIYTLVTGQATAATTAFKIALATTGVGLLVVGILALVQALKSEDDALEDVNAELERNKNIIDADISAIERLTRIEVARAQAAGKAESEITRIRGRSLVQQRDAIEDANKRLLIQADALNKTSDEYIELNRRIDENKELIKDLNTEIRLEGINLQKQLSDEAKKSAEEAKKAAEDRVAKLKQLRLRELNDQLAALERQLLAVEEGSVEELRIKQRIVAAKSRIELEGENLTQNQILLIKERAAQEQLALERGRIKRLTAEAIAGQISLNNAVLAAVQTGDEDRLLLQISNIELAAQQEIDAAEGNATKIKEIIAKRDADIAATRKAFIEQQAQQEIDLITAREGANNRALQRISQDENQSVRTRITAIQQLAEFELNNISTREQALEEQRRKGLIGEEEYNVRYAQLQDDKAKVSEDAEKKITDIHLSEAEKRKLAQEQLIEFTIQTAQQVLDAIGQFNELQIQRDEERIEGERARVRELLEAGSITEKEAIARNKRIDNEEKKLQREAAIRDKNLAIFNAIISTAAAVTKALPNLFLAGIAAALGAAQIAVIAARPIPKFRGGKKNRYEGPGIIGEAGPEIFEHDGKRYIANKETLVWLGKDDKVYTPTETKQLLPSVDREAMNWQPAEQKQDSIDYEQLGKAVGKHVKVPGITVDNNGFSVYMQEGLSRKMYMDKYYNSK